MISETVLVALIGLLGVVLGGAVGWYFSARKLPREMKVMNSEESENLSTALNLAVQTLTNSLQAANAERLSFETRINELEAHRDMRSREIYNLQQKLEGLNREYTQEVTKLRDQIESQATEWRTKYENLKKYTEKLRKALKDANIDVPEMPDNLMDTLEKIKASKP